MTDVNSDIAKFSTGIYLNMKHIIPICMSLFVLTSLATRQAHSSDIMGAHVNFGRGCSACHETHMASVGTASGASQAALMLWGEDVTSTYVASEARSFDVTVKNPEQGGLLTCLTCHDGNYAPKSMMKDTVYEAFPSTYGVIGAIPTLIDKSEISTGRDFEAHPVGIGALVSCGGVENWDCPKGKGSFTLQGANLTRFAANYGMFVKPIAYEGKSIVVCTTCHNPHSMSLTSVSEWNSSSAYAPGIYPTKYFLLSPYAPYSVSRTSNVGAQYCRQCHANLSNEMNGSTAITIM
jgi:hypothetical protein